MEAYRTAYVFVRNVFAQTIGLPEKTAEKIIKKIISNEELYLSMCDESLLPSDMKEACKCLICERIAILK